MISPLSKRYCRQPKQCRIHKHSPVLHLQTKSTTTHASSDRATVTAKVGQLESQITLGLVLWAETDNPIMLVVDGFRHACSDINGIHAAGDGDSICT